MKEKRIRKNKGITLIALIITIIILIILAAVTIKTLFNENFIKIAMRGTENYVQEEYKEEEIIGNINKKLSEAIKNIENGTETEKTEIYARLYQKKSSKDEQVLILASKEKAFSDYSSELDILLDFGNIYEEKTFTEEDLYKIPEFAEMLQSEEWKEYKEADSEGAIEVIAEILVGWNKASLRRIPMALYRV